MRPVRELLEEVDQLVKLNRTSSSTPMRKEGIIVRWNDAKGFGFIRSGTTAQDVFVHVRDFRSNGGEAPREGMRVTFEDIHVGGKGPRAVAVQPISVSRAATPQPTGARPPAARRDKREHRTRQPSHCGPWLAVPLIAAYSFVLVWLVWHGQLPGWVLLGSLVLNLLAFAAYWQDKQAARNGRWRIKEDTLHLWSLAGGWGGAWFAQQVLRHKSAKTSFRAMYWATVVMHCALAVGIGWWFSRTQ